MTTTINVSESTKEKLKALKIHERQPYEEVILGLIEFRNKFKETEEGKAQE